MPRIDRHFFRGLGIVLVLGGIIAVTGVLLREAIWSQREEVRAHATVTVARHAASFQEQITRHLLTLDQTLRVLAHAWEQDPQGFELLARTADLVAAAGLGRDLMLVDENGVVRQSTIPDAVGSSAAEDDYFRFAKRQGARDGGLFVGKATIGSFMRQWHMNVARALHRPDGSFAGVLVADYRLAAVAGLLRQADLGSGGMLALVGVADGKLRAYAGAGAAEPDTAISGSAMFAAILSGDGTWIGPSAPDGVRRVLAYRRLPGRDLIVVAGSDFAEAMAPATQWELQAKLFGGCLAALVVLVGVLLLRGLVQARRRAAALTRDRAALAAAYAQLEVAKAFADGKTGQLEATLAGMTDGVSMIDGHFCLVEWNARFPEIAGIPAEILQVGMPLEQILHAQARAGQFGTVDPDAEVARRMAALQSGLAYGTIERRRPDGRVMELRRNRLPDGGFVTLYADITERKRIEEELRQARAAADATNEAKSRFVAMVSHEIRTPLHTLLNTLRLLAGSGLESAQDALVANARQSGSALIGLLNDILDMSSMEAGQLTLRPSVFTLRPLLETAVEMFLPQASERGIELACEVAPDVPSELFADPGRLRQVLLNLLSNAVKFGRPGKVRLLLRRGDADRDGSDTLRFALRDRGPVIPAEERARLFRPFARLDTASDAPIGAGLGLAICRHLAELMGGAIGCSPWADTDGRAGNEFWLRLPIPALPLQVREAEAPDFAAQSRALPRTRILLVEDVAANQLVTATLLRREGHLVDIAGDGAAAIAAVAGHPYDLVLMDFFMPGLSGPETSQRIRQMRGVAEALPILALTANVSPDDHAIARRAGMDGLLGKPVALRDLLDAVAEHVWGYPPEQPGLLEPLPADPGPAAQAPAGPVLAAHRVAELRRNLTPHTLPSLIEACLQDVADRLPILRRALEADDRAEIASQTHAMAGLAAGYGMAGLEAKLRTLMVTTERPGDGSAAEWVDGLAVILRETAGAWREALAREPA